MVRLGLLATAALGACALVLPAAPVPKHIMPKEEPYFYPTKVGAKHVSTWKDQEMVEVVSKVTPIKDGFEVETEMLVEGGKREPGETVRVTTSGLVRTHSEGHKLAKPYELLRLPHTERNSWESESFGKIDKLSTAGWEEIEVPAGKFRAMRVDLAGTSGIAHWYAPGIGCVNWYCTTSKVGRPLKSFTPGK
jgi:hypothetical protein